MNTDLIAIANSELAEKLRRGNIELKEGANEKHKASSSDTNKLDQDKAVDKTATFKQDIWRAVLVLNLMRYGLGILLIVFSFMSGFKPELRPLHPTLLLLCTGLLLVSAIAFTYFSRQKIFAFNRVVLAQFSLDILLAALITYSYGSVESNFAILFFIVVATGSVVLPKVQALGLASGAIIALFFEHFYSVWVSAELIKPNYPLLAQYGVVLLISALLIAYLAERIRLAELKNFVPGNESIENFLLREETSALRTALEKTNGNKTEAAKLLGMTFRSFRYKLSKYEIGKES